MPTSRTGRDWRIRRSDFALEGWYRHHGPWAWMRAMCGDREASTGSEPPLDSSHHLRPLRCFRGPRSPRKYSNNQLVRLPSAHTLLRPAGQKSRITFLRREHGRCRARCQHPRTRFRSGRVLRLDLRSIERYIRFERLFVFTTLREPHFSGRAEKRTSCSNCRVFSSTQTEPAFLAIRFHTVKKPWERLGQGILPDPLRRVTRHFECRTADRKSSCGPSTSQPITCL